LQNGRGISAGNYFSTDKFVDWVHVSVDRSSVLGPPWTDGGADRGGPGHGGVLTVARPPAAPVRQSSPAGRKRERGARGARLGPHRSSGGAVATERRWWRDEVMGNLVGKVSGAGGEEKGAVRCGVLRRSSGWLL
jgi:hypothetical protein